MEAKRAEKGGREIMKNAAIWWRVSGENQLETSPDTQISEALAMAQEEGYSVPSENILGTDWHSLSVWDSPPMEQLKELIRSEAIDAVFMYEPDRAPSKPAHRLLFRALCEEHGVRIRCRHGQIPDGDMAEVMEFLSAWAKEKQVHRAQQGAKDGMRDRAKLRRLPPVPKNPYGYVWDDERRTLLPTAEWEYARLICRWALQGWSLNRIRNGLHDFYEQPIPSPTGKEWWGRRSIYVILTNPVYGGRYYALRRENVIPRQRRHEGYGKTGCRYRPLEEAVYIPEVTVKQPPLTWEEWLTVQEQFKLNKLQASRNAKRDYLLRSMMTCETHHRRYGGTVGPKGSEYWQYRCSGYLEPGSIPCPVPFLNGRELEHKIKDMCRDILNRPELIEAEVAERTGRTQETLQSIERQLASLDAKENKAINTEANLVVAKASGDASPEAYERALTRVKAQLQWIAEERKRLQAELETVQKHERVALGLREARKRLLSNLERGTTQDWREILNTLGVRVSVAEDGVVHVGMAIPVAENSIVCNIPSCGSEL